MTDPFHRCTHCRGFYPAAEPACIYCNYAAPLLEKNGDPKTFDGRDQCREIQIAEYRQLPEYALTDPMRPPEDEPELLCACLHCGQFGPRFEAIEMRWLETEGLWACPCTICGGRGFHFDIHEAESRWECAQCQHKWRPPDDNFKASNCKCPKCGCTEASGMFDDEHTEEEIEAMSEEEYKTCFGMSRAEEEAAYQERKQQWEREHPEEAAKQQQELAERRAAWEEQERAAAEAETLADQGIGYDPEAGLAAEREEEAEMKGGFGISYPVQPHDDDIDFPHIVDKEERQKRSQEAFDAAEAHAARSENEADPPGELLGDNDIPY